MAVTSRTRVGIVGAGPAGLLLAHLLALHGIESVVVENRSREYCEARQRAGLLEAGTVELLRGVGLGKRLDAEGMEHGGIYLQFDGQRHHLDFRSLTDGRWVTIYAQTEIVKDMIAARLAAGAVIEFSASDVAVSDVTSDRPVLSYRDASGVAHEVSCDVIAGCDGFHGICRPLVPNLSVYERAYPYAWLGILADAAPSTDELIYSRHRDGFALYSMRSPEVSRLYLQVAPDEPVADWPDDRIWAELQKRFAVDGWSVSEGTITDKSVTAMRSFVAVPMRHGRLFLAGDAAHIVPPTGAKGLNLAFSDVIVLAGALRAALLDGSWELAGAYSDMCLDRVWRATHFSWWMTSMLHVAPGQDPFESQLQLAQLRYVTSSRAAAKSLAENYCGYKPLSLQAPA
ncbi:4-hydroxybenzoate 3-monooxygenase [Trebonia sp.]|uniref:4-hydroxybenzoate 3-monooxygenase n=1 Tax=Trebonia sp. TaxID=2767075 RepID=UPI002610C0E0|nr:4-hydroxybenzoate 3-monooxygenase [Trebonia sp.]